MGDDAESRKNPTGSDYSGKPDGIVRVLCGYRHPLNVPRLTASLTEGLILTPPHISHISSHACHLGTVASKRKRDVTEQV